MNIPITISTDPQKKIYIQVGDIRMRHVCGDGGGSGSGSGNGSGSERKVLVMEKISKIIHRALEKETVGVDWHINWDLTYKQWNVLCKLVE